MPVPTQHQKLSCGVEKVRLTGGEPMLRRDIETLVAKLARIEGVKDLALTTNGFNLAERAAGLKAAGLDRITVSLDSLKRAAFTEMTGVDMLSRVLARDALTGLPLFAIHAATILVMFGLLAVYVVDIFRNQRFPEHKQILWCIALLAGNAIAMPIYWWLYVRPHAAAR